MAEKAARLKGRREITCAKQGTYHQVNPQGYTQELDEYED